MTSSEGAGRHAGQAGRSSGSGLSPDAAATAETPDPARQADGQAAAPLDARQLLQEIERTRERLGQTVAELAARADVMSRARATAAELSGTVKSKTAHARKDAAARADNARRQFADQTAAARQKAISAGGAGKDQLRNRVAAASKPVWEATPEPVRQAVRKGASSAREHWVPLAVAAGALIVGGLALRQWTKR
jgi:hypothetical protein